MVAAALLPELKALVVPYPFDKLFDVEVSPTVYALLDDALYVAVVDPDPDCAAVP